MIHSANTQQKPASNNLQRMKTKVPALKVHKLESRLDEHIKTRYEELEDGAQQPMLKHAKTMMPKKQKDLEFNVMDDPDYPVEAVNSNVIVEEIEMNGRIQKIYKKTYTMIDGKTINVTRMEQA